MKENLGQDQLIEKLYTFNPYLSITFRFGAAPFKGAESVPANDKDD